MRNLRTAGLITLGTLAACSGDPVAPPQDQRVMALTFTSPNLDDGAVRIRITGAPVDSVTAQAGGLAVRVEDGAPDVAEFVITGEPLGHVIGQVWFAEPVLQSKVLVTVIEVASSTTYEVRDPLAYRVSMVAESSDRGPLP